MSPLKKEEFKKLVKKKIISYWEILLRSEALNLPSLTYFKPSMMSLCRPHPLFSSAGSSPSKVSMATVQALMLSGRYRTEYLLRYWSSNSNGFCKLSPECSIKIEDVQHIVQICPALADTRETLREFTNKYVSNLLPTLSTLILKFCVPSHPNFCDFLLDCSTIPEVVCLVQSLGGDVYTPLFDVTRTWIYVLHRERLKRLNRWKCS